MPPLSLDTWECSLQADRRLNRRALAVAAALAHQFRTGRGSCQLSAEEVAGLADIINLSAAREAMAALRLAGWITSEPAMPGNKRRGMIHKPTMSPNCRALMAVQLEEEEESLVLEREIAGKPNFVKAEPSGEAVVILGARPSTKP
jgi:hypothetical protein